MYLDHAGTSPKPQEVHSAFGRTYRSLEHMGSTLDDDKLVQVFGLFAFIGGGRAQRESWWGAEKWFSDKIADPNARISTACEMLPQWLKILQEIAEINSEVTKYLVGDHLASLDVSQIQPKCRKVGDDYQVAVRLRRGLSQRALAVLYKFRVEFDIDLHTKTENVTLQNKSIKQEIRRGLDTLIGAIARSSCDPGAQDFLERKSKDVSAKLETMPDQEQRKLSVLELTEMIDLCSVKEASFLTSWDTVFHPPQTLQKAMKHWAGYVESWGGRHNYLCEFLKSGETSRNSPGYALVLEYEASLGKHWPIDSNHEVEHIFANKLKETSGTLPHYGFESPIEYELFYNTVGNILPLDDRLNSSLQHRDPRFKAPYYGSQTCLNGNTCAPAAMSPCAYNPSAVAVGKDIQAISADPLATRYLVELRTLELTIYALMRY